MGGGHVEVEESDAHVTDRRERKTANGHDVQICLDQYPYYLLQHDDQAFYGHQGMIVQDSSFAQVQDYADEIDDVHYHKSFDPGSLSAFLCHHCNPCPCFFFFQKSYDAQ